jgi:hypothetical protein
MWTGAAFRYTERMEHSVCTQCEIQVSPPSQRGSPWYERELRVICIRRTKFEELIGSIIRILRLHLDHKECVTTLRYIVSNTVFTCTTIFKCLKHSFLDSRCSLYRKWARFTLLGMHFVFCGYFWNSLLNCK